MLTMRVKLVASLISIGVFLTACGAGDRQVEVSEPFVSVSEIGISELKTAITEEIIEESTTEEVTEVETEEVTEESVEVEEPESVVEDLIGVDEKPVETEKHASKKSNATSSNTAQKPQSTPQTTPKPETSTSSEPKMETAEPVSGLTPEEQALVDALWEECGGGIVVNPQPPVGDGDYDFDDSNVIMH